MVAGLGPRKYSGGCIPIEKSRGKLKASVPVVKSIQKHGATPWGTTRNGRKSHILKGRYKKMTYKEGKTMIESIFAATAKGHEKDAFIKCSNKIDSLMESGDVSFYMGDRLKNYLFIYRALVTC